MLCSIGSLGDGAEHTGQHILAQGTSINTGTIVLGCVQQIPDGTGKGGTLVCFQTQTPLSLVRLAKQYQTRDRTNEDVHADQPGGGQEVKSKVK